MGLLLTNVGRAGSLGKTMAATHYSVQYAADNTFVLPAGINSLAAKLNELIAANSITSASDFNAKIPVFGDPHFTGYIPGSGAGVTAGQACKAVACINPLANFIQNTFASQPLLLLHNGLNYYASNSAATGNSCSTPDATINRITDNFDLVHCIGGWESGRAGNLNKSGAYSLYILTSGVVRLQLVFATVATNYDSTITLTTGANWIRATRDKASGEIKFYQSSQSVSTALNAITWAQLGTTVIGSTASCDSSANAIHINNAAVQSSLYRCYRATISNSIGGSPVVDFNPQSFNPSISQTQFTTNTGEVYTINQSTAYGSFKGYLVDKTIIVGDGVSKNMTQNYTVDSQPYTFYAAMAFTARNNGSFAWDCGSTAVSKRSAMLENGPSQIKLYAGADGAVTVTADKLISLYSCLYSGAGSSISKNNGTPVVVSTSAGTNDLSGITLMSRYQSDAGSFLNGPISTILVTISNDNSTVRTAIYNTIRSMNNNAF